MMNNQTLKAAAFALIVLASLGWVYYDEVVGRKVATREEVLAPTGIPATAEDVNIQSLQVIARAVSASVSTTTINIAGCQPIPYSITAIYGEKVSFLNPDSVSHTLSFMNTEDRTVSPGSMIEVSTLDLMKGEKKPRAHVVASYGCDSVLPAGVVNLTD